MYTELSKTTVLCCKKPTTSFGQQKSSTHLKTELKRHTELSKMTVLCCKNAYPLFVAKNQVHKLKLSFLSFFMRI
jgi:glycine betaine/choline ABC-type transport system substrate-binding protein